MGNVIPFPNRRAQDVDTGGQPADAGGEARFELPDPDSPFETGLAPAVVRQAHEDSTASPRALAAVTALPTPTESLPAMRPVAGYTPYAREGQKYTGPRDVSSIAKDIRNDLRRLREQIGVPPHASFSVRSRRFAGGQAIDVEVRDLSDDEIYTTSDGSDPNVRAGARIVRPDVHQMRRNVERIVDAYNRIDNDPMVDYFDTLYYSHVTVESEARRDARIREREFSRARSAARRAGKRVPTWQEFNATLAAWGSR